MENEKTDKVVVEEPIDNESSDEEIEVKPKIKKERTPAQVAAFKKAMEVRDANKAKRQEEKKALEEMAKKQLEEKIVRKAIAIKKKQIKQEKIVEPESESEEEQPPARPVQAQAYKQDYTPKVKPQAQAYKPRVVAPPPPAPQRKIVFL